MQVGRSGVRDVDTLGLLLEGVRRGDEVALFVVRIRGRSMMRSTVVLQAR